MTAARHTILYSLLNFGNFFIRNLNELYIMTKLQNFVRNINADRLSCKIANLGYVHTKE